MGVGRGIGMFLFIVRTLIYHPCVSHSSPYIYSLVHKHNHWYTLFKATTKEIALFTFLNTNPYVKYIQKKNKAVNIPFNFFLSNYIRHLILNKKRGWDFLLLVPQNRDTPRHPHLKGWKASESSYIIHVFSIIYFNLILYEICQMVITHNDASRILLKI